MASKYQRKSNKGLDKSRKPIFKGKSQGEVVDLEAIERHEEITGINRAKWDEVLHARAAAHSAIYEARGYDA